MRFCASLIARSTLTSAFWPVRSLMSPRTSLIAAYDDYFNTVSEQTDDHLAAAMLDDDIPDFGA